MAWIDDDGGQGEGEVGEEGRAWEADWEAAGVGKNRIGCEGNGGSSNGFAVCLPP